MFGCREQALQFQRSRSSNTNNNSENYSNNNNNNDDDANICQIVYFPTTTHFYLHRKSGQSSSLPLRGINRRGKGGQFSVSQTNFPTVTSSLRAKYFLQQVKMVRAWFYNDSNEDQREPHMPEPPVFLSLDELYEKTGLEYFNVGLCLFVLFPRFS